MAGINRNLAFPQVHGVGDDLRPELLGVINDTEVTRK